MTQSTAIFTVPSCSHTSFMQDLFVTRSPS